MKLYSAPGSCSSASHIALLEAGADFELIKLDLQGDRKLPDGRHLTAINPKGYVPVLELDDGALLTENTVILQYIADQYPDARLGLGNGKPSNTSWDRDPAPDDIEERTPDLPLQPTSAGPVIFDQEPVTSIQM